MKSRKSSATPKKPRKSLHLQSSLNPKSVPAMARFKCSSILQRDARLIDFLMEDISGYSDDQVGAAVRSLHEQSRAALTRYVTLSPVIDAVEGTRTQIGKNDPNSVKLIGNVPANGKASQGILRHKGWRAEKVDLPKITGKSGRQSSRAGRNRNRVTRLAVHHRN